LSSLGNAYFSLADYVQAIEYQQKSLAIAREIGNCCGEGNVLGSLGIVYNASETMTKQLNTISSI
jgi:tetratricopeptide (TPR) repeat protein